jgi:hypothetical protein
MQRQRVGTARHESIQFCSAYQCVININVHHATKSSIEFTYTLEALNGKLTCAGRHCTDLLYGC